MPVFAAQVTNPVVACSVTVHIDTEQGVKEEQVKLTYYRARITRNLGKRLETMGKMEEEEAVNKEVGAMLIHLIEQWDVLQEENGPPVPLTEEALEPMDVYFKMEVLLGIAQYARERLPGEAVREGLNSTRSSGSSRPTVKRIGSQKQRSQKSINS